MATLDSVIDNTRTLQDIELASALDQLKKNPAEYQRWLTNQQSKVYDDIVRQKSDTFSKIYGDFDRASKVEESILMHNKRSRELTDMMQQIYEQQENGAAAVVQDKDVAKRIFEMNEWTVGNKQDTLFVLSSLFIMLSAFLLITALWKQGLISSAIWVALGIPLFIIFLLILIRRWRYTDVLRNKRYWNKQIFEGKYEPIALPGCPNLSQLQGSPSGGAPSLSVESPSTMTPSVPLSA
jgi:uncharacterized protein YoxC